MMRRSIPVLVANPFRVLNLPPTASKDEVKMKYRELAKKHHPDNPGGDQRKMEQVNKAYHTLIKDGAYEKLHVPGGASPSARDKYAKMGRLDPETERAVPSGGFAYKNQSGNWEKTDEPLKNNTPRYASYASQKVDHKLNDVIRARQEELERMEREKSWFRRNIVDKYDFMYPHKHPVFVVAFIMLYACGLYQGYKHAAEYYYKMDTKLEHYSELRGKYDNVEQVYPYFRDEMHLAAVAAACVYIAAATKKNASDPIVEPSSNPLMAKPVPHFYYVHSGA